MLPCKVTYPTPAELILQKDPSTTFFSAYGNRKERISIAKKEKKEGKEGREEGGEEEKEEGKEEK